MNGLFPAGRSHVVRPLVVGHGRAQIHPASAATTRGDDGVEAEGPSLLGEGLHLAGRPAAEEEGLGERLLVGGQGKVVLRGRRYHNPADDRNI